MTQTPAPVPEADPATDVPEQVRVRAAKRAQLLAEGKDPYPPGVPVVAPGEVITEQVVDYLRSGIEHGFLVSDSADPSLETFRVLTRP